uniref:Uncharacterized protein n=1 Tax=Romanomermis culicivorax TaxID=13658 RepID=A0A915JSM9_ROMCU
MTLSLNLLDLPTMVIFDKLNAVFPTNEKSITISRGKSCLFNADLTTLLQSSLDFELNFEENLSILKSSLPVEKILRNLDVGIDSQRNISHTNEAVVEFSSESFNVEISLICQCTFIRKSLLTFMKHSTGIQKKNSNRQVKDACVECTIGNNVQTQTSSRSSKSSHISKRHEFPLMEAFFRELSLLGSSRFKSDSHPPDRKSHKSSHVHLKKSNRLEHSFNFYNQVSKSAKSRVPLEIRYNKNYVQKLEYDRQKLRRILADLEKNSHRKIFRPKSTPCTNILQSKDGMCQVDLTPKFRNQATQLEPEKVYRSVQTDDSPKSIGKQTSISRNSSSSRQTSYADEKFESDQDEQKSIVKSETPATVSTVKSIETSPRKKDISDKRSSESSPKSSSSKKSTIKSLPTQLDRDHSDKRSPELIDEEKSDGQQSGKLSPVSAYLEKLRSQQKNDDHFDYFMGRRWTIHTESVSSYRPSVDDDDNNDLISSDAVG